MDNVMVVYIYFEKLLLSFFSMEILNFLNCHKISLVKIRRVKTDSRAHFTV